MLRRRATQGALVALFAIVSIVVPAHDSDAAAKLPTAPRKPTAVPGNARATLSWLAPTSNGGAAITSYVITGLRTSDKRPLPTVTSTTTSVTVTGLTNGTNYGFRVAARNSVGIGPTTAQFTVKPGVPGIPTNVVATAELTSGRVSWTAPANNGSTITGYTVTKFLNGASNGSKTFASSATTQTITDLVPGGSYRFTVFAKNSKGAGAKSAQSNAIVPTAGVNQPPTDGGFFALSAPGSALPSDSTCAAQVRRSSWEPVPSNTDENQTTPPQPLSLRNHSDFNATWQAQYKPRITGNFKGTTDEIIQWASCKWGMSDEMTRAQAYNESNWRMDAEGDDAARSAGVCTQGDTRDPCPTSFGILQIKWYYNPDASPTNNSYPRSRQMTAFSLDYALAQLRGCYEGMEYFGSKAIGDMWGCFGAWYSGKWKDTGANSYITRVKASYNKKPWSNWGG